MASTLSSFLEDVAARTALVADGFSLHVPRAGITLRPVTSADLDFCRTLFHDDRAADFAPLHLDAAMLTVLLDQQFHAQQIGYRQAYPDADDMIVAQHGAATGRVTFDRHHGDAVHLINIALLSSARGRGIGSTIIAAIEQAAREAGIGHISLSVMNHNSSARRLYARLGFRATADDGVRVAMTKALG